MCVRGGGFGEIVRMVGDEQVGNGLRPKLPSPVWLFVYDVI